MAADLTDLLVVLSERSRVLEKDDGGGKKASLIRSMLSSGEEE